MRITRNRGIFGSPIRAATTRLCHWGSSHPLSPKELASTDLVVQRRVVRIHGANEPDASGIARRMDQPVARPWPRSVHPSRASCCVAPIGFCSSGCIHMLTLFLLFLSAVIYFSPANFPSMAWNGRTPGTWAPPPATGTILGGLWYVAGKRRGHLRGGQQTPLNRKPRRAAMGGLLALATLVRGGGWSVAHRRGGQPEKANCINAIACWLRDQAWFMGIFLSRAWACWLFA